MEGGRPAEKEEAFMRWFLQNGGRIRDIAYAHFPPTNYLGVAATRDIPRNTVIMSVPKSMIIGVERVKSSELGGVMRGVEVFEGEDNDDKDFNMLALFVIMEKMKGPQSFFAPYLDCITLAENLMHWSDSEVEQIGDPFLNCKFVREVKADFEPTFLAFSEIVAANPAIFKKQLTRDLFDFCYGVVMTRCFGWGLPETMLVPLADFLNHHSSGVHHYAFSLLLEANLSHSEYIRKATCLDLEIVGCHNHDKLPLAYEKDSRQVYVENNVSVLQ